MQKEVKLSSKNQIVIPKFLREKLNLNAGDYIIIGLENNNITFRVKPKNYTKYMLGLGERLWREENVKEYIRNERKLWEK